MQRSVPVRVGDHDAETVPHPRAARRTAELFATRNLRPTLEEIKALSERFADATQALQIAIANESFSGVRSAHLTLSEIIQQAEFMNTGVHNALLKAHVQETRR